MSYSLGVTITTIGRPSLTHTMSSAAFSECHVIVDPYCKGDQLYDAAEMCRLQFSSNVHLHLGRDKHTWGDRNAARKEIKATHLAWIDDDDVFVTDAWEKMLKGIEKNPEGVNVFRALYPNGKMLWNYSETRENNVCTPNIIVPNAPWVGGWADERAAAEYFFQRAIRAAGALGLGVMYHDVITALIRPVSETGEQPPNRTQSPPHTRTRTTQGIQ